MNREFTLGDNDAPQQVPPPRSQPGRSHWVLVVFLLILLLGLLAFMGKMFIAERQSASIPAEPAVTYLRSDSGPKTNSISPTDIPPWLMAHVALIGALQIVAVLFAARVASRPALTKRDGRLVLFLCEIPMYLGLFGTLMGVCLTQFIAGSLVAPVAYFSTMGGVVLHVLAKLAIWLRLPEELIDRD